MKIGIIGGGGVRTPMLVAGLSRSDLPLREVVLFDVDRTRLEAIGALARHLASPLAVRCADNAEDCVQGADFVLTTIRVQGMERRARDEEACLAQGVLGQETVGPEGFAMAARTIGPMIEYARLVAQHAPQAWMINLTNPVGIITQAVRTQTGARIIGVCDTPTKLFEAAALQLGLPFEECHFDYVGLNHLGWLREIYHRGQPQLERLWSLPEERLHACYRAPLFDAELLRKLRMLPSEYLYYYYRTADAVRNFMQANTTRGRDIERLTLALFEKLRDHASDLSAQATDYSNYMDGRHHSYMRVESAAAPPVRSMSEARSAGTKNPYELSGYDRIALAVIRGIHFNRSVVLPLNVGNRANIPELENDDVIEAPCLVNCDGALPMHVGAAPESIRPLLTAVKSYERQTVAAVLARSTDQARRALATNPIVGSEEVADRLLGALSPLW